MINWTNELKKPVNLISIVISVFSLSFAILTYDYRGDGRELSYRVYAKKILNIRQTLDLVILRDQKDRIVSGDVHLMYLSLWNSGKKTITKNEIVDNPIVEFSIDGHILSVSPITSNFKGGAEISARIEGNRIVFELDELDLDMGAKYRVIFTDLKKKPSFIKSLYSLITREPGAPGHTLKFSGYIKEGKIINSLFIQGKLTATALLLLGLFSVSLIINSTVAAIADFKRFDQIASKVRNVSKYLYAPSFVLILYLMISLAYLIIIGPGPASLHIGSGEPGMDITLK